MVEAPNGIAGLTFGSIGVPAAELPTVEQGDLHEDRGTGSGEGGLNDQRFFANASSSALSVWHSEAAPDFGVSSLVEGLSDRAAVADQIGSNGNAPRSSDSHPVQSQLNACLVEGQEPSLSKAILNEHLTNLPQ